jgi:hypothetical protein
MAPGSSVASNTPTCLINVSQRFAGCAFSLRSERVRRVLRASGKAVWTWPPVIAVDAGSMEIQWTEGVSLRCADAVLRSMALHTATARAAWRQKSVAKMVVEEVGEEIGVAGR